MKTYLDNYTATPPLPEVLDFLAKYQTFGYYSQIHYTGQRTAHAIEQAMERIAAPLDVSPQDLIPAADPTIALEIICHTAMRCGAECIMTYDTERDEVISFLSFFCKKNKLEFKLLSQLFSTQFSTVELERELGTLPITLLYVSQMNASSGSLLPNKKVRRICNQYHALWATDLSLTFPFFDNQIHSFDPDFALLQASLLYAIPPLTMLYAKKKTLEAHRFYKIFGQSKARFGKNNELLIGALSVATEKLTANRLTNKKHWEDLQHHLHKVFDRTQTIELLFGESKNTAPNMAVIRTPALPYATQQFDIQGIALNEIKHPKNRTNSYLHISFNAQTSTNDIGLLAEAMQKILP